MNERRQANHNEFWGIAIGGAIGLILSAPACLAAFAIGRTLRERRDWLLGAALPGAGVTVLMWGPIATQFERAGHAIARSDGILFDPQGALAAVWPHMRTWWFQAIGLAPAIAFGTEALRPKSVGEQLRSREKGEVRRRERKERRARRSLGISEPERRPEGLSSAATLPTGPGAGARSAASCHRRRSQSGAAAAFQLDDQQDDWTDGTDPRRRRRIRTDRATPGQGPPPPARGGPPPPCLPRLGSALPRSSTPRLSSTPKHEPTGNTSRVGP